MKYRHLHGKLIEKVYSSGMRWLHIDDEKASSAALVFRADVGSHYEVHRQKVYPEGTAHLLEHSILINMTPEAKSSFKDWNAFTTAEATSFLVITTPEEFMKGFDIMSNLIFNFNPSIEVKREVEAINSE